MLMTGRLWLVMMGRVWLPTWVSVYDYLYMAACIYDKVFIMKHSVFPTGESDGKYRVLFLFQGKVAGCPDGKYCTGKPTS